MPMDFKFIQRLAQLMQQNELTELELDDPKSGARLRLERGGKAPPPAASPVVHVTHAGGMTAAPTPVAAAAEPVPAAPAGPPPGTKTINSPMVGTFYRSPSPEAESFVQAGSTIKVDSVICIIEAMKVMNEIRAEVAGTVVEVLVENGQPVEFGQPLFLIRPA